MTKFDKKVLEFFYSLRNQRSDLGNAENFYSKLSMFNENEKLQILILMQFANVPGSEIFRSVKQKLGMD